MSLKADLIEVGVVVLGIGALVWFVESRTQAAGGIVGLSSSLFSWASGGYTDVSPGNGAIPAMGDTDAAGNLLPNTGTLNTSNATQSQTTNDLLNSSLIMQSIGM